MSRLEKYRRLRNGELNDTASATETSEPDLKLSKAQSSAKTPKKPKVRDVLKKTLDKPKPQPSTPPEPVLSPKAQGESFTRPAPMPPSDSSGMVGMFLIGFGIFAATLMGMVAFMAFLEYVGDNQESRAQSKPQRPAVVQTVAHKGLDFFITDQGVLVNKPEVKDIALKGQVIGTNPVFTKDQYGQTRSSDPMRAEYTVLLLEDGGRLPVGIALPWLKQPVAFYTATHRYTGRMMICLARPVNQCAFPHRFD